MLYEDQTTEEYVPKIRRGVPSLATADRGDSTEQENTYLQDNKDEVMEQLAELENIGRENWNPAQLAQYTKLQGEVQDFDIENERL